MKAVIMAGGEGTRLRPLTCCRPKPMVPVANKPVMEHILELLKKHGITNIAATLQYMPDLISEYFEDGDPFGVKLRYYIEDKPLGTAGSVKNAEAFLDDTFLVISGDALTDIDLKSAVRFHRDRNSMATLILKRVDIPLEYGVVVTGPDGRIIRFLEKPSWGEVFSDTANTGIYILSPEVFDYIKPGEVFDFSRDLFPLLLKENKNLFGYVTEDYWCDIGDIGAYLQAQADILNGAVRVNIPGREFEKGIWIGSGTEIAPGVKLNSPCIIGSGCHLGENTEIGSYSVIGDNNVISKDCSIKHGIVWKNCSIGAKTQLRGSILCGNVNLKQGVAAYEQSVIGERSLIGERAIINPSVKIWPGKLVGPGAEVDANLVWGSKTGRQIFGNRGVTGDINIDMTPEFSAKLGASLGAVYGNKGRLGISSDGSPASIMIRNAFVSGLVSSGIKVYDFGRLLLPVMRSAVRFYRLDGGVHISVCSGESTRLVMDFLDKSGNNVERGLERKIENIFARDDFGRCSCDCISEITEVRGYDEFYLKNILRGVKSEKLNFKIALNTTSHLHSQVISDLLAELGASVKTVNDQDGSLTPVSMGGFSGFVVKEGFDMGVSIEESCEKMVLVDRKGRIVLEDTFIALISLVLLRNLGGGTVVVPLSASQAVEKIAEQYQGKVIRTKNSSRDIMGQLLGRNTGEELLEQFTLHFDAIAGLVRLLDYMSVNRLSLSELVDMLPEIHMHRQEVECGWNSKGKVIRRLIQENGGNRVETLEGVKVYNDRGWVLVLPDAEKPMVKVIGESTSAEFAEELTNIYARKVREISRS
ncbi:MAG TPA: sugar phosphate nucleotidyltransferase [Clostridia bacterium]|nr:sugar phosphate nucleotidyltransferase [Clostridia bacterium]